ncbi:hypothetical protein BGX28_008488 [Mortierella sp. GBA30]|nr:hypothetical protein BGX28_008488 [Mortierella sp. GBA30]
MELGVKVVTVYAFSIENFKRPPDQVDTLMELGKAKLAELCERSEIVKQYGISIRVLGDDSLLPDDVRKTVRRAVDLTKNHKRAILNMCFPYTSRQELTMASRSLVSGIETSDLDPSDITTSVLDSSLYTRSCPPMDILIRTSGEIRLSDFMLWQSSRTCYVEFIDCLWPEFTFWKLVPILLRYQLRAGSMAQLRWDCEQRDEREWRSATGPNKTAGQELEFNQDDDGGRETLKTSMDIQNATRPTFLAPDCDDFSYSQSKEKRQRVAEFLANRGHLPNCPLVQLQ